LCLVAWFTGVASPLPSCGERSQPDLLSRALLRRGPAGFLLTIGNGGNKEEKDPSPSFSSPLSPSPPGAPIDRPAIAGLPCRHRRRRAPQRKQKGMSSNRGSSAHAPSALAGDGIGGESSLLSAAPTNSWGRIPFLRHRAARSCLPRHALDLGRGGNGFLFLFLAMAPFLWRRAEEHTQPWPWRLAKMGGIHAGHPVLRRGHVTRAQTEGNLAIHRHNH